jgi:hypothetical protein
MNKTLEYALYGIGGLSVLLIGNQIYKRKNGGIGLFTTDKKMGTYVGLSDKGLNKPYTKDTVDDFVAGFWKGLGKDYKKQWFKAVYKSEIGEDTPTFTLEGKTYWTKGGTRKS